MSRAPSSLRTPDELRTLYATSPNTRDIFVEGREDRDLVRWHLHDVGLRQFQVYAIDDRAFIDSSLVDSHCPGESGCRGRTIALAVEAAGWGLLEPSMTCIVDRDRNCLIDDPPNSSALLITDHGSMDVYTFSERPLQKFLDLVVRVNVSAGRLIEELTPILNELFVIRAAMHEVAQVGLIKNHFNLVDVDLGTVDSRKLVQRSLGANEGLEFLDEVLIRLSQLHTRLPEDRRLAIRGHDIAPLLIGRLQLRNNWAIPAAVEAALRGCLDSGDLQETPLFSQLEHRISR